MNNNKELKEGKGKFIRKDKREDKINKNTKREKRSNSKQDINDKIIEKNNRKSYIKYLAKIYKTKKIL